MSILPEGLTRKWQIAACDLPVPETLTETNQDGNEWAAYVDCLSTAQQMRKLGQTLDQLDAGLCEADDLSQIGAADGAKLYSKWLAAQIVAGRLAKRLELSIDANDYMNTEKYQSDIDYGLAVTAAFLKDIGARDAWVWEARRGQHLQHMQDEDFRKFISAQSASQSEPDPNARGPQPPQP